MAEQKNLETMSAEILAAEEMEAERFPHRFMKGLQARTV